MPTLSPPSTLQKSEWPPNYVNAFAWRQQQLLRILQSQTFKIGAKEYYKDNPVAFINHWCITYDPRNAGKSTPTKMPFIMFRKQEELVEFLLACLKGEQSGLIEKCRDLGATWVCCAFSVWLWLFWPGAAIGWGSRKEQLVDRLGDPASIFEKLRMLIENLPPFFLPVGFAPDKHLAYMKIINPENGATITGEAGDNIGRGGRNIVYFKDESAHYPRPELIEAALGDNTRVTIDISSVNGTGNVFHRRRESGVEWKAGSPIAVGAVNVFVMDYSDHPEKDINWYNARKAMARAAGLMHIFAQEVERNYSASIVGGAIPSDWIASAVDAHLKLGFTDDGPWGGALDVADSEDGDRNSIALRKGVVLKMTDEWVAPDVGVTTRKAIGLCSEYAGRSLMDLQYDCIGVGSGVKSEANRLLEMNSTQDAEVMPENIRLIAWAAGAPPLDPDEHVIPNDEQSALNKDFYKNIKAQAWWNLRLRFERTHRSVTEGIQFDPSELISLPSDLPMLNQIKKELAQATVGKSGDMKMIINKTPEGTKSPNVGDSIVMAYHPVKPEFDIQQFIKAYG